MKRKIRQAQTKGKMRKKESADYTRRQFLVGTSKVLAAAAMAMTGLDLEAAEKEVGSPFIRRRLGRTGLMVSGVAMGGSPKGKRFGWDLGAAKMGDVFRYAYDRGVNFFSSNEGYNTYPVYGAVLKGKPRDSWHVWAILLNPTENGLDRVLKQMQADYVDIISNHGFSTDGRTLDFYLKMKEKGKVKFIGSGAGSRKQVEDKLIDVLGGLGCSQMYDDSGAPFNSFFTDAKLHDWMRKQDVKIVLRKVMRGRWLWHEGGDGDPWSSFIKRRVDTRTHAAAMVKYVLSYDVVGSAMIGMQRESEVDDNLAAEREVALAGRPSAADLKVIRDYDRQFGRWLCHNCSNCGAEGRSPCEQACPQRLPVSHLQRYFMYHRNYGAEEWAECLHAQLSDKEKASNCRECGECQKACPHGIHVLEKMRMVKELFKV